MYKDLWLYHYHYVQLVGPDAMWKLGHWGLLGRRGDYNQKGVANAINLRGSIRRGIQENQGDSAFNLVY